MPGARKACTEELTLWRVRLCRGRNGANSREDYTQLHPEAEGRGVKAAVHEAINAIGYVHSQVVD